MDDLAKIHLNKETIKYKEVVGSGKSQITFDQVDLKSALKYAAEDADITYKLYLLFKKRINHEKNNYIYSNIEKPFLKWSYLPRNEQALGFATSVVDPSTGVIKPADADDIDAALKAPYSSSPEPPKNPILIKAETCSSLDNDN